LLGAQPAASVYVGDNFQADYCGASSVGMHSFLIDPNRSSDIPDAARLNSLFDLEDKVTFLA
jgi:FMN phosphatase YigB (HAD superfamily)